LNKDKEEGEGPEGDVRASPENESDIPNEDVDYTDPEKRKKSRFIL